MAKTFTGKSTDAQAPFLKQAYFKKGTKIEGIVLRTFENENGLSYVIHSREPLMVNGKKEQQVAIGAMAGLRMALNAAGLDELQADDRIILECTGLTPTDKGNPRTDFKIAVQRD